MPLNRAFSLGPSAETPPTADPAHAGKSVFQAGKYSDMTAVSAGLSLPYLAARQHLHSLLEQRPGHSRTLSAQQASQMAKGVPRMRDLFLFHSSLPGVQIPSCFLSPLSYPVTWGSFLQLWL